MLKMKNNIGSEFTIAHKADKPQKTLYSDEMAKAVATIDDMIAIQDATDGDTVIVKAGNGNGGIFVYDSTSNNWVARITW